MGQPACTSFYSYGHGLDKRISCLLLISTSVFFYIRK